MMLGGEVIMNRKIAVVGLGYVGLPVAVSFGIHHEVIGFDISDRRIKELKEGYDRTNEVTDEQLGNPKRSETP